MRKILFALLTTLTFTAKAQSGFLYPDTHVDRSKSPAIFIDSIKMDSTIGINYLGYLNPNDIANIVLSKEKAYVNGALYIALKDHAVIVDLLSDKWLSIRQIVKAKLPETEKKKLSLYFLDDKLVTDTAGIRIPSKHVNRVTINRASEMPYLKAVFPNMLIVRIYTKPEVVNIRGAQNDVEQDH